MRPFPPVRLRPCVLSYRPAIAPRCTAGRTAQKVSAGEAIVKKLNAAVEEAGRNARQAGYSIKAVNAIGRIPSDVFLFSKLPEADQQAILRQANKEEFERYIGHAHQKLRMPMRHERAAIAAEKPAGRPPATAPTAVS